MLKSRRKVKQLGGKFPKSDTSAEKFYTRATVGGYYYMKAEHVQVLPKVRVSQMKYSKRLEVFERVRGKYAEFLKSVLWKLTGDKELFAEALQYALLQMWRNVHKLNTNKAGAYIYKIALTATSKAWRNRIGKDGQLVGWHLSHQAAQSDVDDAEAIALIRRAIAQLPARQGRAIVMRYLEQKDYKALAEELGCSQAGARSHVSKALARLKTKLANFK